MTGSDPSAPPAPAAGDSCPDPEPPFFEIDFARGHPL